MPIFTLIAFLGMMVVAACGWFGHSWYDHHADIEWTAPALVRWAVPADLRRVHIVGAAVERDRALAEAARADAALAKVGAQTTALRSSLAAQNAAVEAIAHESARRIAASQKASLEARKDALRLREQASQIMALQKPASLTACEAADALILKEAR